MARRPLKALSHPNLGLGVKDRLKLPILIRENVLLAALPFTESFD